MRPDQLRLLPWLALLALVLVSGGVLWPAFAPSLQSAVLPQPTATPTLLPTRTPTLVPVPTPTLDPSALANLPGRILFTAIRDERTEIYSMNASGTDVRQLTTNSDADWVAKWSPDGKRIAFASNRDFDNEIYVMNTDGTYLVQLTDNTNMDTCPVWSPDGDLIVYSADPEEIFDLYLVRPDGQGGVALTQTQSRSQVFVYSWSQQGRMLAMAEWDGDFDIYSIDARTTQLTMEQLTENNAYDGAPDWSPDGTQIVFDSDRDGNGEIYVMDADGGNVVRLTNDASQDYMPRWSPDGRHIAFTSNRDGNAEIYLMEADGTNLIRLTQNNYTDILEDWL